LPLVQRVTGMLFSPQSTIESVVASPKWVDVLVVTVLVSALVWAVFLWSPVGSQAFIDQMTTQATRSAQGGAQAAAQAAERVQQMFPVIRIVTVCAVFIVPPIIAFAVAGLLYAVFGAIMGGGGTYKQVLAVVVHAGVVQTVGGILVMALNYLRGTMTSMTNLAVFAPMLPEESFIVKFLSAIDLVWIWYLVILAIGLAVLYRRKTANIAISFFGLYLVVAIIIAVFKRAA
jgi:hypothetical protein